MIILMRYVLIFAAIVTLIGCSSEKEITKSSDKKSESAGIFSENDKNESLEHFIDGSIAESKGDYASAILEYQDALRLNKDAGIYYAIAKNYFFLDKIPLAIQNIKQAIGLDSNEVDYYELLSNIFSAAGQYDSSASALNKLISIDSSRVDAYYELARIYETSKPLMALTIYNKLLNRTGPEWNVLIRIAEVNDKLGRTKESIDNIKRLLSLDPMNVSIQKLLAKYYQRNKEYDEAIKILNNIIQLTPDDLDARKQLAQVYIEQNDWKSAAKEFSSIITNKNVPFQTKLRIGDSYFAQSLKDSTLLPVAKNFFETINKDTTNWQVKMYLAAIALNEGKDSAAIDNFKKVTELANWNVQAWVHLGGLYYDNQKYNDAVMVMQRAVQSFPENEVVNLILGLSLEQSGKHEDAAQYLEKAVQLNSSDVNALSAYAYNLNERRKPKEAIEYLKRALVISPDDINLLGTLGLIYNAQKRYVECDSVYELALKIDSSNALINNNYAYSLSVRGIKLDEALRMVKISLKAEPKNSAYLDTAGWIYFKLDDYKSAKDYISQAIKIGGDSPTILEHLGDVEFKMGEKDTAIQLWQKAYSLDKTNSELKLKIEKGEI